mmetsp:Transcript_60172/g.159959  ORF Transcript_60172/g.159959 Transcript_60172/m.159959 type:complete len:448 (+) Transcript_60172:1350-2693(+)
MKGSVPRRDHQMQFSQRLYENVCPNQGPTWHRWATSWLMHWAWYVSHYTRQPIHCIHSFRFTAEQGFGVGRWGLRRRHGDRLGARRRSQCPSHANRTHRHSRGSYGNGPVGSLGRLEDCPSFEQPGEPRCSPAPWLGRRARGGTVHGGADPRRRARARSYDLLLPPRPIGRRGGHGAARRAARRLRFAQPQRGLCLKRTHRARFRTERDGDVRHQAVPRRVNGRVLHATHARHPPRRTCFIRGRCRHHARRRHRRALHRPGGVAARGGSNGGVDGVRRGLVPGTGHARGHQARHRVPRATRRTGGGGGYCAPVARLAITADPAGLTRMASPAVYPPSLSGATRSGTGLTASCCACVGCWCPQRAGAGLVFRRGRGRVVGLLAVGAGVKGQRPRRLCLLIYSWIRAVWCGAASAEGGRAWPLEGVVASRHPHGPPISLCLRPRTRGRL